MDELPTIGIVGYGAMGKEVERLAFARGFEISGIYDVNIPLSKQSSFDFDVAIDFSTASAVEENVRILAKAGKNIVIGTTGWQFFREEIFEIAENAGIGLVWASNFSLGMNMFFEIVRVAAKLVNDTGVYDIMLHEMHHSRKKDSPSGTALRLADIILKEVHTKSMIITDKAVDEINASALHVSSTRGGAMPGTHNIYIDSEADAIELTHRAKNRSGFALGALEAVSWIHGKKGIYEFSDVLAERWRAR